MGGRTAKGLAQKPLKVQNRCRFPTPTGPCHRAVAHAGQRCHDHADKDIVTAAKAMAKAVRTQQERLRAQSNEQHRMNRFAAGRRSDTTMSDAQISAVVATMNRNGVHYVIIGGVASQLHGAPVERTYDIDVVPERSGHNLDALARALEEMRARLWVGADEPGGLAMVFDRTSLSDIQSFLNLVTDHGPLDITYMPDGTQGYPDLRRSLVIIEVGTARAPVAALEDVIRSKEAAGRAKDLDVIPRLLRFLKGRPAKT